MVVNKTKSAAGKGIGRRNLASDDKSSLPVYHQLYVVLRQQIVDGVYSETVPLPTEMKLATMFAVSRVTVRRALEMLERENLVVRRQGVGTFAAPKSGDASVSRLSGLVENLITIGIETTAELLAFDAGVPAPLLVANALTLAPDALCVRLERLRCHKGKPVSLSTVYLPAVFAPLLTKEALDDRPVVRILEQAGIIAVSAEQTLSAVAADDRAATHLGVAIGSPLIRLRRTVFDYAGKPILYQQSLYTPDRYEYHMLLTRDNSTPRPHWRHIG